MSEKPRPNNQEAEQSVLGAALQSEYAAYEATETLKGEEFFNRFHAEIFTAMQELVKAGIAVDLVTVSDTLKRRSTLEAVGGSRYLAELVSLVPAPSNITHYVDIVRSHAIRRRLIEASENIVQNSISGEDEATKILDNAELAILEIGKEGHRKNYTPIKDVLEANIAYLEELSKLGAGNLTGLATGFTELDKMTLGLQKSDLIILAARPGEGKTSLALNIAVNAALKKNAVVLIFSLEMSEASLGLRLLSSQADVNSLDIRNGKAFKDTASSLRIGEAAQELAKTKIFIDDTVGIQMSEIKNKCRSLKQLDLVIVDYLQLMDMDYGGSGKTSRMPENRQQEVTTLTRMLKQLARDLECPVLVLSQLSREGSRRSNSTPILTDLRESGAIEQDADIVMFIHQKKESKDGTGPDVNLTRELIIAKHRQGETGSITLRWFGQFTKFANYDASEDWLVNVSDSYVPDEE